MVNMGPWDGLGGCTGIAHPATHPVRTTPGTPPPYRTPEHQVRYGVHGYVGGRNMVVGLKSVRQLSLSVHFSGFLSMTEVYNLMRIGRINNHYVIPGTD